jgi:hypothetical protein
VWLSTVILTLLQAAASGAGAGPVTGLLPTPADLGGACDYVPAPSRRADGNRVTSGLWGGLAIPTNPWTGANPDLVAQVRARVVGPVRMPDGPPLDARDAARFQRASVDGAYGYVAAYEKDDQRVLVHALQSPHLLGAVATDPPTRRSADGSQATRIKRDGLWMLISGSGGPCFEAVRRHVDQRSSARPRE